MMQRNEFMSQRNECRKIIVSVVNYIFVGGELLTLATLISLTKVTSTWKLMSGNMDKQTQDLHVHRFGRRVEPGMVNFPHSVFADSLRD